MGHLTYEESKKLVTKTILILGAITISEVIFALIGKGHLIEGVSFPGWIVGGVMIVMSIVKAYLIIYEFMHMGHEVRGLRATVLLPMCLLIWAVIAFFNEGAAWKTQRTKIQERNQQEKVQTKNDIGMIYQVNFT